MAANSSVVSGKDCPCPQLLPAFGSRSSTTVAVLSSSVNQGRATTQRRNTQYAPRRNPLLMSRAGNVGVVSGIFFPQYDRHANMLAP
jgi:hypothetical protein